MEQVAREKGSGTTRTGTSKSASPTTAPSTDRTGVLSPKPSVDGLPQTGAEKLAQMFMKSPTKQSTREDLSNVDLLRAAARLGRFQKNLSLLESQTKHSVSKMLPAIPSKDEAFFRHIGMSAPYVEAAHEEEKRALGWIPDKEFEKQRDKKEKDAKAGKVEEAVLIVDVVSSCSHTQQEQQTPPVDL